MKQARNQILVYYPPDSSLSKKTLAMASTIAKHVQSIEITKATLTGRMWRELLTMLNLRAKDLLDRSHPYYQEKVKGNMFEDEDWLNVLIKNPELIKAPIVIMGDQAIFCETPTDILKLTD